VHYLGFVRFGVFCSGHDHGFVLDN
jgi:hypothetical protein